MTEMQHDPIFIQARRVVERLLYQYNYIGKFIELQIRNVINPNKKPAIMQLLDIPRMQYGYFLLKADSEILRNPNAAKLKYSDKLDVKSKPTILLNLEFYNTFVNKGVHDKPNGVRVHRDLLYWSADQVDKSQVLWVPASKLMELEMRDAMTGSTAQGENVLIIQMEHLRLFNPKTWMRRRDNDDF